ncbi:hypothetical protein NMY22_g692 [Coprinellus aureogranulatus]|nr:hypothetical protein NMY22_g692 [Coprinellus aureogranulatus]
MQIPLNGEAQTIPPTRFSVAGDVVAAEQGANRDPILQAPQTVGPETRASSARNGPAYFRAQLLAPRFVSLTLPVGHLNKDELALQRYLRNEMPTNGYSYDNGRCEWRTASESTEPNVYRPSLARRRREYDRRYQLRRRLGQPYDGVCQGLAAPSRFSAVCGRFSWQVLFYDRILAKDDFDRDNIKGYFEDDETQGELPMRPMCTPISVRSEGRLARREKENAGDRSVRQKSRSVKDGCRSTVMGDAEEELCPLP